MKLKKTFFAVLSALLWLPCAVSARSLSYANSVQGLPCDNYLRVQPLSTQDLPSAVSVQSLQNANSACELTCTVSAKELPHADSVQAQPFSTQELPCAVPAATHRFALRDTCALYLDFYPATAGSQTHLEGKEKPAIVFVFGGGFIHGSRNGEGDRRWFKLLNDRGYPVFSIDYRLGMKGVRAKGLKFVNATEAAIKVGVEDLFAATRFIVDHAGLFGVRPDNLVVSGTSAGAIIAQQAEYEICNRTGMTAVLPEGFNYAGVMAFSGAIFSRKGKLRYALPPCPTLMLHGTADKVVTYKQIKLFNLGFFGADRITARFRKFGFNYNTLRYEGRTHEVAESMIHTLPEQLRFLETNVVRGENRVIDALILNDPTLPEKCRLQNLGDLYD